MAAAEPEETFRVSDRRRSSSGDDEPRTEAAPGAPDTRKASPKPPGREGDRSLVGLFMTLASSAAIAMGDVPDPATGQRQHDLATAAGAIDLLVLLREKTEGRRSVEEDQVLNDLIYSLQLRYVDATKRAAPPPGPPPP